MDDEEMNKKECGRRRGLTSLTLQWIAEKLRRTAQIKEALERGTYRVDSNKVAEAILNGDNHPKQ
jgi:anti-sigma28 factor (negative regulator of flagellin synthesis)